MSEPEVFFREPFAGRFFGIFNVEGEGDPIALFVNRDTAVHELARRQALPVDHEAWPGKPALQATLRAADGRMLKFEMDITSKAYDKLLALLTEQTVRPDDAA